MDQKILNFHSFLDQLIQKVNLGNTGIRERLAPHFETKQKRALITQNILPVAYKESQTVKDAIDKCRWFYLQSPTERKELCRDAVECFHKLRATIDEMDDRLNTEEGIEEMASDLYRLSAYVTMFTDGYTK
jgi:hypothetical protein